MQRTGIDPKTLEDVILGIAYPEAAQGNNIARLAALLAGLPIEVGGMTMNRFCGSSMSAMHYAAGQIDVGMGEAFIARRRGKHDARAAGRLQPLAEPRSRKAGAIRTLLDAYISMGETAENVAQRYGISPRRPGKAGLRVADESRRAQREGRLRDEIVPVQTPDGVVDADGCSAPPPRSKAWPGSSPLSVPMASVTAGTSSPLTDGAATCWSPSEAYARTHGLEVLARIRSVAIAGVPPEIMGMGPVPASQKALARAGLTIRDIDVVEINEAFGSRRRWPRIRELGIPMETVNIDGGGLAIGHPLGATGARITAKAAQIMKREGKRYALSTQCIGGGQGIATVIEAVS